MARKIETEQSVSYVPAGHGGDIVGEQLALRVNGRLIAILFVTDRITDADRMEIVRAARYLSRQMLDD